MQNMFTDRIRTKLIAGKGGNGIVSWRREKYLPKGGPTGGNGGPGGSIKFQVDPHYFSLDWYKNKRIIKAPSGIAGGPNQKQGAKGKTLVLKVPPGTLVKDANTGHVLYDLKTESDSIEICKGGKGGLGNAFFKNSRNQAPNFCTPGKPGQELEIELELKLIADIGLVGFPNAGKSTLLHALTDARAKAAPYPFTTLCPNLGFYERADYTRVTIADIPGIIEGAHLDKGLGFEFLRHIERTKGLLFVIDGSGIDGRDPIEDFEILLRELNNYNTTILEKPFFILLNKNDSDYFPDNMEKFINKFSIHREKIISISSKEKIGIESLRKQLNLLV